MSAKRMKGNYARIAVRDHQFFRFPLIASIGQVFRGGCTSCPLTNVIKGFTIVLYT